MGKIRALNDNEGLKSTLEAFLKFGTVFLVYRACNYYFVEGNKGRFFDPQTTELAIMVFLGFALYFNVVKPLIPVNARNDVIKNIINDTLTFGTVLVTQHSLDCYLNEGSCFNQEWAKNAAMVIAAFAAYRVSLGLCVTKEASIKGDLVRDLSQYGSFLVFYKILQGCDFNEKWLTSVMFVLVGFSAYHGGVRKIINVG